MIDDNVACIYGCVTSSGDGSMTFKPSYGCATAVNEDNSTSEQLARIIEMIINKDKDKTDGED